MIRFEIAKLEFDGDKLFEVAVEEEEFGMVVLSVGMVPSKGNESLAGMMNFGLDEHGFCETGCFSPNEIEGRPGIFPAATFTGPMDIPDSIASATGAGSLAAQLLHGQRDSLTRARTYPDERPVEAEGARIGVFVCHCGSNIAAVADTRALAEYALTLDDVVHCEEQVVSCTADSFDQIIEAIREKGLNRVVVAACSPRHHEAPFREALRDAGLNPYLHLEAIAAFALNVGPLIDRGRSAFRRGVHPNAARAGCRILGNRVHPSRQYPVRHPARRK